MRGGGSLVTVSGQFAGSSGYGRPPEPEEREVFGQVLDSDRQLPGSWPPPDNWRTELGRTEEAPAAEEVGAQGLHLQATPKAEEGADEDEADFTAACSTLAQLLSPRGSGISKETEVTYTGKATGDGPSKPNIPRGKPRSPHQTRDLSRERPIFRGLRGEEATNSQPLYCTEVLHRSVCQRQVVPLHQCHHLHSRLSGSRSGCDRFGFKKIAGVHGAQPRIQ
eukprot:5659295-Amphidinium_carterae.2